jgi:hypothetical protein
MSVSTQDRELTSSSETKPKRRLTWLDVALLGIAASFVPLNVMAHNPLDFGHPERPLLMMGLVWLGALGVVILLMRFDVRRTTAVYSVFTFTALMMNGGRILFRLGEPVGWLVMAGLLGMAIALMSRAESHRLLTIIYVAVGAFLISGPAMAGVEAVWNRGQDRVEGPSSQALDLTTHPDVFVVVFDGYAGRLTLAEDFGLTDPTVFEELERRGFEVPNSVWSAYPSTRSSVPSMLDMSYPVEAGPGVSVMSNRHLSDIMGGSNAATSLLEAEGYESVMIESGWSGSRCGDAIDRCVSSSFLDEAMFSMLAGTVGGPAMLETFGNSFTVGSRHAMNWVLENGPEIAVDGRPTFVFAHVMAPHPPFFLDGNCRTVFDGGRNGYLFARPTDDVSARREAYLEQAQCLNGFMMELSDSLPEDTILIFVSDHGTDKRNQLSREPETWTQEDLTERYNAFLAVRDGPGCSVGDEVILPNVLRRVLSCLSAEGLEDLEPRMFMYAPFGADGRSSPVTELDQKDVLGFLGPDTGGG